MTKSEQRARKAVAELAPYAQDAVAKGEELRPTLFVHTDGGGLEMILLAMPNKNAWAMLHQGIARERHVECAVLLTEAWSFKGKPTAAHRKMFEAVDRGEMNLGQVPGSVEVVMMNVIAGETQWLVVSEIDRKKKKLRDAEWVCTSHPEEGDSFAGRMIKGPNSRKGH